MNSICMATTDTWLTTYWLQEPEEIPGFQTQCSGAKILLILLKQPRGQEITWPRYNSKSTDFEAPKSFNQGSSVFISVYLWPRRQTAPTNRLKSSVRYSADLSGLKLDVAQIAEAAEDGFPFGANPQFHELFVGQRLVAQLFDLDFFG